MQASTPDRAARVVAGVGGALAGLLLLLGLLGCQASLPLAALASASLALWVGRGLRSTPWLLLAAVLSAAGQILHGVLALIAPPRFPTVADLATLGAGVAAVVGLLAARGELYSAGPARARGRRSGVGRPPPGAQSLRRDPARSAVTRLLDAAAPALPTALLVCLAAGGPASDGAADAAWFAVPTVVAQSLAAWLVVLQWVRRPRPGTGLVAAGVVVLAAAHMWLLHAVPLAGPRWPGAVGWCVGWPLIAVGLLRLQAGRGTRRSGADGARRWVGAVLPGVAGPVLLVAGLAAVVAAPGGRAPHTPLLVLAGAALVCLALRETVQAWERSLLASRLTARLRVQQALDPVTGLANRQAVVEELLRAGPATDRRPASLIRVGLDGFTALNDVLGEGAGDRLLRTVGQQIAKAAPSAVIVARLGGDEFAVLVPGDLLQATRTARALVAEVDGCSRGLRGAAARVPLSASAGVAPVTVADPVASLSAAGHALRTAKSEGRGRVAAFDRTAARVRHRRSAVEERLRIALDAGALHMRYQPIVDLGTGRVASVECLARWDDPELGTVDPDEFIPIAERTGLVVGLGELVLDRSLRQAALAGLPGLDIRIGCNVSPVQLREPGFHRVVERALDEHGVPPGSLIVEVTEAVLVEEGGAAVRSLRRIADLGVAIAIDDFGTGYSALGYLRRLPAHILKIDRSLTSSLLEDPSARAVTRAVVDLSRSIGLSVVVEGIQTTHEAELVTRMGVGFGQGSLYGAAQPLDLLLARHARDLAAAAAPGTPGDPPAAGSPERDSDDPVVVGGG